MFVYLTAHGSGSYGKLIGYSTNNGKSVSQVSLPDIAENDRINKGLHGGTTRWLSSRTPSASVSPIYKDGDTNANPTGGMRQIQYKLVDGEACRILQVDKVLEF